MGLEAQVVPGISAILMVTVGHGSYLYYSKRNSALLEQKTAVETRLQCSLLIFSPTCDFNIGMKFTGRVQVFSYFV
jgi:hypothetical protein